MSTKDLDSFAEKRIIEMGAVPSFKGLYGFPASIVQVLTMKLFMVSQ